MRHIALTCLVWLVLAQGAPFCEIDAWGWCRLRLDGTSINDFGDGDGIADTNETLQIGLILSSHCRPEYPGEGLRACVARLSTESPAIDCMRRAEIAIGNLQWPRASVTTDETFEIKIGVVDRHDLGLGPDDPLDAVLSLEVDCLDGSDPLSIRETIVLPLDRNVSDQGQAAVEWKEDFEGGGIDSQDPLLGTAFFAENLDAGLPGNNNSEGLLNADGWRCPYSDPDWSNASSYNQEQGEVCYPGIDLTHADAIFWRLDGSSVPGTPDGGRAFRGEKSLYFGVFLGQSDEGFTTPTATVESVGTHEVINLGAGSPELSLRHQVSLADHRIPNARPLRSLDRGVAQIRLFDSDGEPSSDWMVLHPIQNSYDQQAEDNYYNCLFDPVDDGNTEDDFFDPTNPERRLGPSSTCYPAFTWSFLGSTTGAFSPQESGYATTPPAPSDAPSLGVGTWVESRIDLSPFRGRRAKLRFLVASLRVNARFHSQTNWAWDWDERDDGWWIDDIVVSETLEEPALIDNDRFLLGSCSGSREPCIEQCRWSLAPCSAGVPCPTEEGDCVSPCAAGDVCSGPPPDCGADCSLARANLFVEPVGPANPGSVTRGELDPPLLVNFAAPFDAETGAEPSWVDACLDSYKEYRACISGDPDGGLSGLPDADCDDAWDSPICDSCSLDWSLASSMIETQEVVTMYAVEVRCSTVPDCRDGRTIEIVVECDNGAPNAFGLRAIRALDRETLTWRGPLDVDWLRGSFSTGAEIGAYVADFTDAATQATSMPMTGDPPSGTGYYYLVKSDGIIGLDTGSYGCSTKTWRSGGGAEVPEPARNRAFGDP